MPQGYLVQVFASTPAAYADWIAIIALELMRCGCRRSCPDGARHRTLGHSIPEHASTGLNLEAGAELGAEGEVQVVGRTRAKISCRKEL